MDKKTREDFIKVYPHQDCYIAKCGTFMGGWLVDYCTWQRCESAGLFPYAVATCGCSSKEDALFVADKMAIASRVHIEFTPFVEKKVV